MKDRQIQQIPLQMRVPFVSAVLHCISMTGIVFLRSSFGYSYLRPRSVFFAFAWAFILFFIYAWKEKGVWQEYRLMCFYGATAIALYLTHLLIAFFRELFRGGSHDNDSGTPHTFRILKIMGKPRTPHFEMKWHIWVQPILVFLAGLFLG